MRKKALIPEWSGGQRTNERASGVFVFVKPAQELRY